MVGVTFADGWRISVAEVLTFQNRSHSSDCQSSEQANSGKVFVTFMVRQRRNRILQSGAWSGNETMKRRRKFQPSARR